MKAASRAIIIIAIPHGHRSQAVSASALQHAQRRQIAGRFRSRRPGGNRGGNFAATSSGRPVVDERAHGLVGVVKISGRNSGRRSPRPRASGAAEAGRGGPAQAFAGDRQGPSSCPARGRYDLAAGDRVSEAPRRRVGELDLARSPSAFSSCCTEVAGQPARYWPAKTGLAPASRGRSASSRARPEQQRMVLARPPGSRRRTRSRAPAGAARTDALRPCRQEGVDRIGQTGFRRTIPKATRAHRDIGGS